MEQLEPVRARLERLGGRVLTFDPSGAHTVAVPEGLDLGTAVVLDCASPLDPLDPGSHGAAVVAYEQARRTGHGTASVKVAADDGTEPDDGSSRLDIVNLCAEYGCFLAVLTDGGDIEDQVDVDSLPPRRCGYRLSATGVIDAIDEDFTAMLGWTADAVIGTSSLDLIHPDDHENGIVAWIDLLENPGGRTRLRQRFRCTDGEWLWCEVTDTNRLDDPAQPHVEGELLDVSRELAAQAALQRRETLLDRLTKALPTGVVQLDAEGTATVWNDRWLELTGVDPADGLEPFVALVAEPEALRQALTQASQNGLDADLDVSMPTGTGSCRYGEVHLRALRTGAETIGLLVTLDDVTSLRSYQQELADQARRDQLTGVYNRFGIEGVVELHLEAARQLPSGPGPVILFADLDRFKAVNDTFGHLVGDEVLRRVAQSIAGLLRPSDALGRTGGDEFLAVIDTVDAPVDADALARRIVDAVTEVGEEFTRTLGSPVDVGISVGVAEADAADDFDSLVKKADLVMYERKRSTAPRR